MVLRTATVAGGEKQRGGLRPTWARFHVAPGDRLRIIAAGSIARGRPNAATGVPPAGTFVNGIATLDDALEGKPFRVLPLKSPFTRFFTAAPRSGSDASLLVDVFGTTQAPRTLGYARVRLSEG